MVLGSIVVADPVEVMNAFVWEEESPELALHHENMFEHVTALGGSRVARNADHQVAGLVPCLSASPVAVLLVSR